jgi:hypothetical protein
MEKKKEERKRKIKMIQLYGVFIVLGEDTAELLARPTSGC